MRIPSIRSVLALICSGAIISHASAIPDLDMLKVKRDTTATDATDVSLRKIDWKLAQRRPQQSQQATPYRSNLHLGNFHSVELLPAR